MADSLPDIEPVPVAESPTPSLSPSPSPPRPSIEKAPLRPDPFEDLPDEIIEQ
jgi:hypothetical protein